MKTETGSGNAAQRQQFFLKAEALLKYFLGTSEKISTMIMCKEDSVDLITTDYELYQAFGSMEKSDETTRAKITKLLENVDIYSHRKENGSEKKILTHERVDELRKIAMSNTEEDKNE